jgi:hypothetical protein
MQLPILLRTCKQLGCTPSLNAFGQAELNEYVDSIMGGDEEAEEEMMILQAQEN